MENNELITCELCGRHLESERCPNCFAPVVIVPVEYVGDGLYKIKEPDEQDQPN